MKSAVALFLLASLFVLASVAAWAHAILLESTPAVRGRVAAGPGLVTLRFNARIDRDRSRLTLIAPDKTQTRLPIVGSGTADMLVATATVPPGDYVVRWQVLAVDGHITRGDVPFSVAAP